MQTVKDNLNIFKRVFYGVETIFCLFKPSLILDKDFWQWLRFYLRSWEEKWVHNSTNGLATLYFWSFDEFDRIGNIITNGNPNLVDLHDDKFYEIITMKDKLSFEWEKALVDKLKVYDPWIWILDPKEHE